jgi:hypothetical protein
MSRVLKSSPEVEDAVNNGIITILGVFIQKRLEESKINVAEGQEAGKRG